MSESEQKSHTNLSVMFQTLEKQWTLRQKSHQAEVGALNQQIQDLKALLNQTEPDNDDGCIDQTPAQMGASLEHENQRLKQKVSALLKAHKIEMNAKNQWFAKYASLKSRRQSRESTAPDSAIAALLGAHVSAQSSNQNQAENLNINASVTIKLELDPQWNCAINGANVVSTAQAPVSPFYECAEEEKGCDGVSDGPDTDSESVDSLSSLRQCSDVGSDTDDESAKDPHPHLLKAQNAAQWDQGQLKKHELELHREYRRLSLKSI
jgi:hypothetical protein